MTAQQRLKKIPAVAWQVLQMALLGMTGIVFIPALARMVAPSLLAVVLVAQVYVYYLVLLVQFGFSWSGPAVLARAAHAVGVAQVWRRSLKAKLLLLAGPVALLFGLGFVCLAWGQWYLLWFALLLVSFAMNSNWFLQAQSNFAAGVGFAGLGACISACMLNANEIDGAWVVLLLVMPQVCLGLGSWWMAHQVCAAVVVDGDWKSSLGVLRKNAPLVASQLMLLASTTLGTVVVGGLADAETTAAYAATEKLFNLGATVMVGLYMAVYPRFADWFYSDRTLYWSKAKQLLLASLCGGGLLAMLLHVAGGELMALYLPDSLASIAVPALPAFALWLGLCLSQHVLTTYFVLVECSGLVLWANAWVLAITVAVGFAFAKSSPIDWVYGMVVGQLVALVWLYKLFRKDMVLQS